jgi:hypothetical protein
MFTDDDIISVYTRQDAIEDGIFVDVSGVARRHGFTIPVALTTNLYLTHIKCYDKENLTQANMDDFLAKVFNAIENHKDKDVDNLLSITVNDIPLYAAKECQSPKDHSLAWNIMLP